MNSFPRILTAIPKRRFQYGDFGVSVLGEVESGDERDYRYVAAFVKEGESQPRLYVTSERLPPGQRSDGNYALRVINAVMDEVMDTDDGWADLDAFIEQALQMGGQLLGLDQETPYPLG